MRQMIYTFVIIRNTAQKLIEKTYVHSMIATSGAKGMGRPQEFVRESIRITRLNPENVSSLIRRSSLAYASDSTAPTLVRTVSQPIFSFTLGTNGLGENDTLNSSDQQH